MSRFYPPEADRWYVGVAESIDYHINCINRSIHVGDDIDPKGFGRVIRHAEFLLQTLKLGAMREERYSNPPLFMEFPDE